MISIFFNSLVTCVVTKTNKKGDVVKKRSARTPPYDVMLYACVHTLQAYQQNNGRDRDGVRVRLYIC